MSSVADDIQTYRRPLSLEEALLRDFWNGTTADAVWQIAIEAADPLVRSVLMEASARLKWAAEMMAPDAKGDAQ